MMGVPSVGGAAEVFGPTCQYPSTALYDPPAAPDAASGTGVVPAAVITAFNLMASAVAQLATGSARSARLNGAPALTQGRLAMSAALSERSILKLACEKYRSPSTPGFVAFSPATGRRMMSMGCELVWPKTMVRF